MNSLFDGLLDRVQSEQNTDYLTGMVNRRGMYEIWHALPEGASVHCFYMDVDNFKLVNDVYSHSKGDELLLFVSKLLQDVFPGQLVVRLGGDEFVVLCDAGACGEEPKEQIDRLQRRLREEFDESLREVLSFSIGFVAGRSVSENLSVILDQGDEAMYYVKKNGKGSYVNYEVIREQLAEQNAMKDRALTAFREEEFELRFQPVIYLQNSDVYAAKAALYWHFPGKGALEEDAFIPVFEQYGVIGRLDKMMFEQICRWKQNWRGTAFEELQIYVRISARTILQADGVDHIRRCLETYQVRPEEIKLCIEEESFLGRGEKIVCAVEVLSEMGFEIAIENFGSASSFKVLQQVPAHILKLDARLLHSEKENDRRPLLLLRNVIGLGRDLQFMIVAQGIESTVQAGALANYGAQLGLGDFYGKPQPPERFFEMYRDRYFFVSNRIPTVYSFAHHLRDAEGKNEGQIMGEGITYDTGVVAGQMAISFPGGKVGENIVVLPKSVMYSESYTICLWVNTAEMQSWTSVLYITYMDGFLSLVPSDAICSCVFRMKDDREVNEWFDIFGRHAVPGEWAYMCVSCDVITGLVRLYFNGMMIGSKDRAPNLKVPERVVIGGDEYQKSFHGKVAGLEIYHCVLPAEEIERKFQAYQSDPTFLGTKGKK
ncbi:MAG: EAL domain-containing protein [Lachnospiraceae bacterium]|nr:EAL domain-containing protein [Lachnospiraceae bacterium]